VNEFFEEIAQSQALMSDRLEEDLRHQQRMKKKRDAEVARQIRQGVRDQNGDFIVDEDDDA